MRRAILVAVALTSLWSEQATAIDGNKLFEHCEFFTARLPTLPLDANKGGYCIGYIQGVHDALQPTRVICVPDGVTGGQLGDVVKLYLVIILKIDIDQRKSSSPLRSRKSSPATRLLGELWRLRRNNASRRSEEDPQHRRGRIGHPFFLGEARSKAWPRLSTWQSFKNACATNLRRKFCITTSTRFPTLRPTGYAEDIAVRPPADPNLDRHDPLIAWMDRERGGSEPDQVVHPARDDRVEERILDPLRGRQGRYRQQRHHDTQQDPHPKSRPTRQVAVNSTGLGFTRAPGRVAAR